MIDTLIDTLIGSLADGIAGTALAVAENAQARRDTLAHHDAEARSHAARLLLHIGLQGGAALRNRYEDWLRHPRLGHEPLTAELRAAEIALGEAVVALKANPSFLAQALAIAASLRLAAVSDVLGAASIYRDDAAPRLPRSPRATKKPLRSDDRRLSRRTMRIDDVPLGLHPLVARLGADDPGRVEALKALAAVRAGPEDATGMVTRLVTLAMRPENQALIDALVVAAGTSTEAPIATGTVTNVGADADAVSPVGADEIHGAIIPATSGAGKALGKAGAVSVPEVVPKPAPAFTRVLERIDDHDDARTFETIRSVVSFVEKYRWAMVVGRDRITLKRLKERSDINAAFDRVADLPEMQEELRRIHERSQPPRV